MNIRIVLHTICSRTCALADCYDSEAECLINSVSHATESSRTHLQSRRWSLVPARWSRVDLSDSDIRNRKVSTAPNVARKSHQFVNLYFPCFRAHQRISIPPHSFADHTWTDSRTWRVSTRNKRHIICFVCWRSSGVCALASNERCDLECWLFHMARTWLQIMFESLLKLESWSRLGFRIELLDFSSFFMFKRNNTVPIIIVKIM